MLLALDTATRMTGIALHDGARVLAEHVWQGGGHQTVELAPQVALLLQRRALAPSDLLAVAVASGPGSYTGLRIGMALAKGLVLEHNLPLVGIPTLDILAHAQPNQQLPMAALIQAGRGRLAAGWYKLRKGNWRAKGEVEILTWPEMLERLKEPVYVCGELTAEQREILRQEKPVSLAPPSLCIRRPSVLADLAWERVRNGKTSKPERLAPTYLGTPSGKSR
ncbi:MAG: tRNA (adenosine(37)-N6)-threonylcarbamoyltransferase complex dimerization subunit type 1 TsaB [Anaerolineales bacterium]